MDLGPKDLMVILAIVIASFAVGVLGIPDRVRLWRALGKDPGPAGEGPAAAGPSGDPASTGEPAA